MDIALQGASASSSSSPIDSPHGHSTIPIFSAALHRGSGFSSPNRAVVTKEVALKVIPKKKVKGNEEAVWGEMEVLKGLDHPNIVRLFRFSMGRADRIFSGEILRLVRV